MGQGQFPSVDGIGAVGGFDGWPEPLLPAPFSSLEASIGEKAESASTAPSTSDGRDAPENSQTMEDDDQDPAGALSWQLMSLSQRAKRTVRRLASAGHGPLTVSSPEVSEALEDTNTLLRIINTITLEPSRANNCLPFLALACHQHLIAMFQAICDAIHRCLQSKNEQQQQTLGPSSVAQFVMVLQLLVHLINRMDRSLFSSNQPLGAGVPTSGYITPVTSEMADHHALVPKQSEAAAGVSSAPAPVGLLVLVQDIMGTIPKEHENLRKVIQQLQTEMEHLR